ncbi:MAG: hypothetical protein MZV63_48190 [Marinilabiliales bacterium]|nr:hypothetical protein [Marinilabiliales bacterium]
MILLLPGLLPLLEIDRPGLPVYLLHLIRDRLDLHLFQLLKHQEAGHRHMSDVMTRERLPRLRYRQPQASAR